MMNFQIDLDSFSFKKFGFAGYATIIDAFALLNASLLFYVQLIGLQNLYFLLQEFTEKNLGIISKTNFNFIHLLFF